MKKAVYYPDEPEIEICLGDEIETRDGLNGVVRKITKNTVTIYGGTGQYTRSGTEKMRLLVISINDINLIRRGD